MHAGWIGFCNQNADQLGYLAGPSLLTVYVGVVECAPASLPPVSSSLTHARRMDSFCNQNADKLGSLAGPSLLTVYVGVAECASASLPPASSSLTHARRMDGFCNQNADKLGSLAGPSLLTASSRAISEHLDFISGHLGAPRSQAWLREQGDWNGSRATSEGWVLLEGRACKIARAERNSTHSRHTSKGR